VVVHFRHDDMDNDHKESEVVSLVGYDRHNQVLVISSSPSRGGTSGFASTVERQTKKRIVQYSHKTHRCQLGKMPIGPRSLFLAP
jgi:hypothetical protein